MKKGISLHIGLNSVNSANYGGWSGDLVACEFDAEDMKSLAEYKGFEAHSLLTQNATRDNFFNQIREISSQLVEGDIFFLTYSGHGGQLPDFQNEEADGMDETWCLYDGELVDDEIYFELSKIPKGVRAVVLSDSCHSGTVTKMSFYKTTSNFSVIEENSSVKYRAMPLSIAGRTYLENKKFYDTILKNDDIVKSKDQILASVLLISGCQDNQLSSDGAFNGLFTGTLLNVWKGGAFKKSYREFHTQIVKNMPPKQTPNYYLIGSTNPDFEAQIPFTI